MGIASGGGHGSLGSKFGMPGGGDSTGEGDAADCLSPVGFFSGAIAGGLARE